MDETRVGVAMARKPETYRATDPSLFSYWGEGGGGGGGGNAKERGKNRATRSESCLLFSLSPRVRVPEISALYEVSEWVG